ncbi:hypothetical protein ABIB90_006249 [Bradyrhizobium sp. JR4.1]
MERQRRSFTEEHKRRAAELVVSRSLDRFGFLRRLHKNGQAHNRYLLFG